MIRNLKIIALLGAFVLLHSNCATNAPGVNHLLLEDQNYSFAGTYGDNYFTVYNQELHGDAGTQLLPWGTINIARGSFVAFDIYYNLLAGTGMGVSLFHPRQYVVSAFLTTSMVFNLDRTQALMPSVQGKWFINKYVVPGFCLERGTLSEVSMPGGGYFPSVDIDSYTDTFGSLTLTSFPFKKKAEKNAFLELKYMRSWKNSQTNIIRLTFGFTGKRL